MVIGGWKFNDFHKFNMNTKLCDKVDTFLPWTHRPCIIWHFYGSLELNYCNLLGEMKVCLKVYFLLFAFCICGPKLYYSTDYHFPTIPHYSVTWILIRLFFSTSSTFSFSSFLTDICYYLSRLGYSKKSKIKNKIVSQHWRISQSSGGNKIRKEHSFINTICFLLSHSITSRY